MEFHVVVAYSHQVHLEALSTMGFANLHFASCDGEDWWRRGLCNTGGVVTDQKLLRLALSCHIRKEEGIQVEHLELVLAKFEQRSIQKDVEEAWLRNVRFVSADLDGCIHGCPNLVLGVGSKVPDQLGADELFVNTEDV